MFRKTTFSSDPKASLLSELRREFKPYFDKAYSKAVQMLARYPRHAFALMVLAMLASGILTFTVMRQRGAKPLPAVIKAPADAAPGLAQIIGTANVLKQVWALQTQLDTLLKKKQLNAADSLALRQAMVKMEDLRQHLRSDRQPIIKKPTQQVLP